MEEFQKTIPPLKPLYDTWTWNQDAGSWTIDFNLERAFHSSQEINDWYKTSLTKTLEAFSHLVRAWRVYFRPNYEDQEWINGKKLEWKQGEDYNKYLDNVLTEIRDFSAPIDQLSIALDVFVYVRTPESPNQPVQSWVRISDTTCSISASLDDRDAGLWLNICHTLFGPGNKEYGPITGPYPEEEFEEPLDDNELQLLNQPLLEKALRQWEEYFGSLTEVDGIPGIYKYGFLVEPY